MFGKQNLFFLDGIIIVIGAFLGANALVVYLHANRAICKEYKKFNDKLKDHIKDGSILVSNVLVLVLKVKNCCFMNIFFQQRPVMKSFESQLIDYISTARFINNTASFLMDVTFMAGLFIQICAQFSLKGYGPRMYSIQNTMMGVWTAQSIYYIFLATKSPAFLQELVIPSIFKFKDKFI